ncbi:MAG: sugar phosphate isomerase/epimerase family protein [Gemmataceae bacterium]
MLPGYNTNGFAHHRLEDAIDILAELGYRSVALTIDHYHRLPDSLPMRCVIETGARFLLDPRHKHQPTLLDPDPERRAVRRRFLLDAAAVAQRLDADAVSLWSGTPATHADEDTLFDRLRDELRMLLDATGVRLAFEPEPGMFIDTMAKFERLFETVNHPRFGLTLDVGHLHCLGETPIAAHVDRWKHVLWNVHIEDMRAGVHDHLMFGDGEMAFPPVLEALRRAGYNGGVHVELSRHSHDAVNVARRSLEFLRKAGL